ncbi:MAG: CHASE domain-containing protein [Pirellulales bacterium]|nr:CHASE domain-containing protein [Pirellulales bacterium]
MMEQRSKATRLPRRTFWSMFCFTLLGVTVTLYLFYWGWNEELEGYQLEFHRDANSRVSLVKTELDQCLLVIDALKSYYNASEKVELKEFEVFSKPFLVQRKELQALEWIPRVSGNERAQFEETVRKEVFPNYRIMELDSRGRFLPAGVRKEYYPVTYIAPLIGNRNVIGFDIGSEPLRLAALERARDSGKVSVTERLKVMQEDRKQSGFLVVLPIYRKGQPTETVAQRRTALEGFVSGVFWTGDALTAALNYVTPMGLSFDLIDLSAPPEEQLLHHWESPLKAEPRWYSWLYPKPPPYRSEFDFADRRWEMAVEPNLAYAEQHYSLAYWWVLPIGFVLTFLMDLYLWTIASQRSRMEKTVLARTAELRRYQKDLEGMVQERSAEILLANESLQKEIEERKKAERLLQDEAQQLDRERANLQAIFDASQVGMMIVDENAQITQVNQIVAGMVHKKPNDMVHSLPGDALCCIFAETSPEGCGHSPACSRCPIRGAIVKVLQTGERVLSTEVEKRLLLNGKEHRFWFSLNASPVVIDGRRQALVAMMDISELKRAEAKLNMLSVAVEQSPAIIVITDRSGNIEYVNPKFCTTTGYTFDEARGKNPHILKSGKTPPQEYERLWNTILSGQEWRGEFYNQKKNGEFYWEQALIAPVKDNQGKITNFIAVKEDITRRKADEESLKKANEMLENLNQQLQKASEVKSRFLASMSHEIRTPLNAVIGMTGLLLDTKLDKEQRDDVEIIRNSGEMLLSLINDILDFSKIEAEKLELENEPFDLGRCLDEALELVQYRAKEKKLKIGRRIKPGVPKYIKGDVTRLRQILVNLLSNAVKFTEEGEVALDVAGRLLADGRWELGFTVRDTGPGIPPDRQDRLFQSFSQVDVASNRRYQGTGLGLAISKRLCELMGGTMGVSSSGVPGEGAEFHFTILAEQAAEPPPAPEPAAADKDIPIQPLRILLAEDNPINQKVALKILKKIGCRADTAANGLEVLTAIEQIPYDVILMDCQMPEMDGYEAARQIRAIEQLQDHKHVYIIAMTAHAMQGDREECLAAGMDDYLVKPVRDHELKAALQCYAAGRIAEGSPPEPVPPPTDEKSDALGGPAQASEPAPSPAVREPDRLPPGEELLDRELLEEDADLSTDDLRELVEMYLSQAQDIKKDLKASIEAGSASGVKQSAHKLAGASMVCGAGAMVSLLRTLEQQGNEGRLAEADRLLAEFDRRLELTERALKEYLAEKTSAAT